MPARKNYRSIQMPSDTGGIFKIPSLPDSNLKDSIPHSVKVSISAICLNPQKHFGTGSFGRSGVECRKYARGVNGEIRVKKNAGLRSAAREKFKK